jgi:tetratricopeptide (TPR) repeat protein
MTTLRLRRFLACALFSFSFAAVLPGAPPAAPQKAAPLGPAKEEPVGLLLTAAGSKVLRTGSETPLAARAGDILFSGDELRAETGAANFLYCPGKTSQTLDQGGDLLLDAKQLKVRTGKLSGSKPVNSCFLPQLVRVNVASQQHYGVSMTRGLIKPDGDLVPLAALAANVRTEIQPFEAALQADPNDAASLVNEAAIYDRNNLEANALASYRKVAAQWKDAVWVRGRIFELEESLATQAALKAAEIAPDAKTFALLIGVSKYQKLPQDLWLQYADADAKTFSEHMASLRGGGVPPEQMVVLTNEAATTAAVRNAFQTFLKNRAGSKDTIFILVAGHGSVDSRGAYIMTYDSDPEDLSATALPMAELQSLVDEELSKVGRVVFLADVCRAATIGTLKTDNMGSAVAKLGEAQGEMLGLMAARPKEVSYEGPAFGGGHGAFTYSVLKGLGGAADNNDNRSVEAGELIEYVQTNVKKLTNDKQHPRDFGTMANETKLSDLSKPGIQLARIKTFFDSQTGEPLLFAQAGGTLPITPQVQGDIDAYQAAIAARHILPDDPGSAWNYVDRLRGELSGGMMFLQENALRVALEDQAQQVLLKYLSGGQTPQVKTDFESGAKYMEAAARLTPESLYLQARDSFFSGRSLLFDKQYAQATDLLEQSVRTDPGEAYAYNALGIAYLDQAKYQQAIPAFRDAARRAPNWSYPLLGLALTYEQVGNNQGAIRTYQQAMKQTPQYGFLPFDLGLLYQKMNQRRDAEAQYLKAAALMPASGNPLNALGALKASEGKTAEAEKLYRDALAKEPTLLDARHNLGVLLAANKDRQTEAIGLWQQNLAANPDYLTSRISLAQLLAQRNDNAAAIEQYRFIVNAKPEFVAARLALADVLIKTNQPEGGLEQLRAASRLDDKNAAVWERIGDLEKSLNHATEARDAYATALKLESVKSDQKRVRTKMAF